MAVGEYLNASLCARGLKCLAYVQRTALIQGGYSQNVSLYGCLRIESIGT
ncbi:hypothetical protein ACFQDN_12895 [Pseudomonas asuensis]